MKIYKVKIRGKVYSGYIVYESYDNDDILFRLMDFNNGCDGNEAWDEEDFPPNEMTHGSKNCIFIRNNELDKYIIKEPATARDINLSMFI